MTREEGKEFANALKNNYTIDFDKISDFCDLVISALEKNESAEEWYKLLCEKCDSAENKGEWIPVSERLPEEREWYLAVFKEKDTNFQLIPRVADYIGHGKNKWRLIDEEGKPQEYLDLLECVAWMPLPEPYKAESGEV